MSLKDTYVVKKMEYKKNDRIRKEEMLKVINRVSKGLPDNIKSCLVRSQVSVFSYVEGVKKDAKEKYGVSFKQAKDNFQDRMRVMDGDDLKEMNAYIQERTGDNLPKEKIFSESLSSEDIEVLNIYNQYVEKKLGEVFKNIQKEHPSLLKDFSSFLELERKNVEKESLKYCKLIKGQIEQIKSLEKKLDACKTEEEKTSLQKVIKQRKSGYQIFYDKLVRLEAKNIVFTKLEKNVKERCKVNIKK